jgi:cation transport ATPase
MQPYEDAEKHFTRHIEKAADHYVTGLEFAGMEPSEILTRRMAERAAETARRDYTAQTNQTLEHNVSEHMRAYKRRDRQIRREGARMRLIICPIIALAFSLVAALNFSAQNWPMGLLYLVGALAFMAMLFIGTILDHR